MPRCGGTRSGFEASSASITLNFVIGRNNGFRQLPHTGDNELDLSATPSNFFRGGHTEVVNQLSLVVPEGLRHSRWSIVPHNLLTPGMGNGDPEHRLPMVAALDHLKTSIDGDGTSVLANVGCERKRCLDCVLGSVKDFDERGEMLASSVSAHSSDSQQL